MSIFAGYISNNVHHRQYFRDIFTQFAKCLF